jgi:hypothetical protein
LSLFCRPKSREDGGQVSQARSGRETDCDIDRRLPRNHAWLKSFRCVSLLGVTIRDVLVGEHARLVLDLIERRLVLPRVLSTAYSYITAWFITIGRPTSALVPKMSMIGAMKKALILSSVAEFVTGLALLIVPSLVGQLLLGAELTGVAIPVARVAGIALIALAAACWPGPPLLGMLIYNALVTLYLAYLGFAGGLNGVLLWPAVVVHAILTALLMSAFADKQTNT